MATATKEIEADTEEKVMVAFRCSPKMQEFITREAGEESISTLLRTWVREKMESKATELNPSAIYTNR